MQEREPPPWIFKCYHRLSNGSAGEDVIKEWYDGQDEEAQGELDSAIEFLSKRPNKEWKRPKFDKLKGGQCKGFHEIRVSVASGVYRVIGFYGLKRNEFTLLLGWHKKNESETNHNCKIAKTRKQEVINDPTRARQCHFP